MKKYTIRIQRTEYYGHNVDVEAESVAEAVAAVRERYENDEFSDRFDAPDDTESHVYCPSEPEWGEDSGHCGNCRYCDGVDDTRDVCRCRIGDPHADWRFNNNEPCPKWAE